MKTLPDEVSLDSSFSLTLYESLKDKAPKFHVTTPIQSLPTLAKALDIASLHVKRDDLTEFYGNKTRHIKYILPYLDFTPQNENYPSLTISGPGDSNSCRIYAQAAHRVGIKTHLVNIDPSTPNGYILSLLEHIPSINGVYLHYEHYKDIAALGFIEAILAQPSISTLYDYIFLYSYDASWVGLETGLASLNSPFKPILITVTPELGPHGPINSPPDREYITNLRRATREHFFKLPPKDLVYPSVIRATIKEPQPEFVKLALNLEGLILDPIYTGRAMACLANFRKFSQIPATSRVLFWHTGGFFKTLQS